jgi:hypothetical protein
MLAIISCDRLLYHRALNSELLRPSPYKGTSRRDKMARKIWDEPINSALVRSKSATHSPPVRRVLALRRSNSRPDKSVAEDKLGLSGACHEVRRRARNKAGQGAIGPSEFPRRTAVDPLWEHQR